MCRSSSIRKRCATLIYSRAFVVSDKMGCDRDLLVEAEAGNTVRVRELLRLGADIDVRNPAGWTPLMLAILRGREATVRFAHRKRGRSQGVQRLRRYGHDPRRRQRSDHEC